MGNKHVVRLSFRNLNKLGLNITEAYLILPERTDEEAEVRAYFECGPVLRLIPYEDALNILVG